MKKLATYCIPFAAALTLAATSCEQKVDYVNPTWARAISPAEGATLKIDFFKPDDKQVFT